MLERHAAAEGVDQPGLQRHRRHALEAGEGERRVHRDLLRRPRRAQARRGLSAQRAAQQRHRERAQPAERERRRPRGRGTAERALVREVLRELRLQRRAAAAAAAAAAGCRRRAHAANGSRLATQVALVPRLDTTDVPGRDVALGGGGRDRLEPELLRKADAHRLARRAGGHLRTRGVRGAAGWTHCGGGRRRWRGWACERAEAPAT